MNEYTYYVSRSLRENKPLAVFRRGSIPDQLPERYDPGSGWQADSLILLLFMNGELGPDDQISEAEAQAILRQLFPEDG